MTTDDAFKPGKFLRARRPERFSDSFSSEQNDLDRSALEYHLETLTNRSQEADFEECCRQIAMREICPNLLPHTGPSGGGDSKVDSETYPVADSLSLAWYSGIGRESASERWAFAFSAKKQWRDKVKSDVAKIAATGRGYAKAFFISNQFVPDKLRSRIEDELRKGYQIDVRILDRTWLLDRVFSGRHEQLAIETLRIVVSSRQRVHKGPRDTRRNIELIELEQRIADRTTEQNFDSQFVDDCINAALISRDMECPSTETEGRFARADRASERFGSSHQRFIVKYQQAWTLFWWFEDFESFNKAYGNAEERSRGSRNVYHFELLTNLWTLLNTLVRRRILKDNALFKQRTQRLQQELERLSKEQGRPSTSLQAKTLLLQIRLCQARQDTIAPVLQELREIVLASEGLVGYPLEPLVEALIELGEYVVDEPAYDELFETIVQVKSSRDEEISAARLLLRRGEQRLTADEPYEAIRSFGRALTRLYKHESRHDMVRALYLCGLAYEQAGLLWAARGTVLNAASIATNEFWSYNDVTMLQLACFTRLKWLDLQLGRVPHALMWHVTANSASEILIAKGYDLTVMRKDDVNFDMIFGILFLKTDFQKLKRVEALPDTLDRLNLSHSALALLFALGHDEFSNSTDQVSENGTPDTYTTFLKWRNQPAANDLPESPDFCDEPLVILRSNVLGCQVVVDAKNQSPYVEIAESILAALESFFSTFALEKAIAREPMLSISVQPSISGNRSITCEIIDKDGRPEVNIQCGEIAQNDFSPDAQSEWRGELRTLLISLSARIMLLNDLEQTFTRLIRDEQIFERSIAVTSSLVTTRNILGDNPKIEFSAWGQPTDTIYSVRRTEAWDVTDRNKDSVTSPDRPIRMQLGKDKPPAEIRDMRNIKHGDFSVHSLIREALWASAGWSGTGFLCVADNSAPPIIAPMFTNKDAATLIFKQWLQEIGEQDIDERLRISIIRGIDQANPYDYRVVIGVNPTISQRKPNTKYAIIMSRIHRMTPSSPDNLERFLRAYEKWKTYAITMAVVTPNAPEPLFFIEYCISKNELNVREAWNIGLNDLDSCAITDNDNPIIPDSVIDAPVGELLRFRRQS